MKSYSVPLIGGDGIGPEILREGKKVLDAAAEVGAFRWQWKEYPYGAEHWLKNRKCYPTRLNEEKMAELGTHDAIYFGAIGDARVPSDNASATSVPDMSGIIMSSRIRSGC